MSGTLYLCATPIGNLEDITFRVINTLKEVDLIAAEDTRHSIKLLNHFEIKTKMTSYHEYNRVEKAKVLVKQLQEGKDIALITDAGTPGISDPGEELVRQCHEAGITVTALPGACESGGISMSGTLYLCATPIGNLEDITFRVINTLKEVDLIAAEDTRHSIKLLNHFEIKTKMTSYHEYNRVEKAKVLVKQLQEGKDIALITDAGTPGISDPGEELVRQCHEAGITVTALPGACALINALIISGQPTRRFCFEAFLPSDKKERKQILDSLENETRSIIIYEAPHRLVRTLEELHEVLGDRSMTLCRELTKKHESVFKSTLGEILAYHRENPPKGECVMIIEGKSFQELKEESQEEFLKIPLSEHMNRYMDQGYSKKEAMKLVAKDRGVGKREIYQQLLEEE